MAAFMLLGQSGVVSTEDCMAQKSLKCLSGLLQKKIDDPGFSWHPAFLVTSRNTDSHTPDFFSLA